MTRAVFESERRCISNLLRIHWNTSLEVDPTVAVEVFAKPSSPAAGARFNVDFEIDFVDWSANDFEFVTATSAARPNSLGPQLFLTVDKSSLAPVRHSLYFGDSFGIEDFKPYIDHVENAISHLMQPKGNPNHSPCVAHIDLERWQECVRLAASVRVAECPFSRVFVFGGDICFLYFPREQRPVMRGEAVTLTDEDGRQIVAYVNGGELVCVDGWIHAGAMAESY